MVNNYFKVNSQAGQYLLPFNDTEIRELAHTYAFARSLVAQASGKASLFRVPMHPGPWDEYPIVGHRPRWEIETDLDNTSSDTERKRYIDELAALDLRYSRRPSKKEAA